jgi:low temperature requirement protein LtrA
MLQAAALLTVLWSSWASYSWLTNAVPAEEVIPARLVIFAAMAAMLVASLAVPGAFGHYGVLFGSAYFVVSPNFATWNSHLTYNDSPLGGCAWCRYLLAWWRCTTLGGLIIPPSM